jgi:hypothetical protein
MGSTDVSTNDGADGSTMGSTDVSTNDGPDVDGANTGPDTSDAYTPYTST